MLAGVVPRRGHARGNESDEAARALSELESAPGTAPAFEI